MFLVGDKFRWLGLAFASLATFCCATGHAQVVAVSPTAGDSQAFYSNWSTDGNASTTAPVDASYNNYRKGGVNSTFGLPVVADTGDGLTGTWTNASHGGANSSPCCGNPGMFFGQSASSSSYSDAQLFVRSNTEPGNTDNLNDSTGRRRFDIRFGFTENPANWIAGKAANSGAFDLWTGDHGSDTIYLQGNIAATDDVNNTFVNDTENGGNLIDRTNQFVFINQDLMGQSGNSTAIVDERDRDRWHKSETTPGIGRGPLTAQDHSQPDLGVITFDGVGGGSNSSFDTGVGYDGDVPVRWWMELNDPDNEDPELARQVAFHLQAGNVQLTQVFDPGGTDMGTTDDDVVPNPSNDSGNAFQDGYFDWQNAFPVFFMAPNGGANGSEMIMGFTGAGDGDGDGDVDGADFLEFQRGGAAGQIPVWGDNYGDGVGSVSGIVGVPEPSTALLMLGLSAGMLSCRRRR